MNVYLEKLKAISGMPPVRELPKVSKAPYGSFGSAATSRISKNGAANDAQPDAALADLLARYGGYPSIDWQGLALTGKQESALWIVQRPDGKLTTLATVEPISKPVSYRQAWPARFTSPEPQDDAVPAVPAAQAAIARALQHCAACTHWRGEKSHPVCLQGHRLAWRQIGPGGVRTAPSRADARPCPDQTPE